MRFLIGIIALILSVNAHSMKLSNYHVHCSSAALETDSVASLELSVLKHLREFSKEDILSEQDQVLRGSFVKEYEGLDKEKYLGAEELMHRFNLYYQDAVAPIFKKLEDVGYSSILNRLVDKSEIKPEYSDHEALKDFDIQKEHDADREVPVGEVVYPREVLAFRGIRQDLILVFKRLNEDLRNMQMRKLAMDQLLEKAGLGGLLVQNREPDSIVEVPPEYFGAFTEYIVIDTSLQAMRGIINNLLPIYINLDNINTESTIQYLN